MKIHPLGAELSTRTEWRTVGRTNRHDEANSRSSQFCEKCL